MREMLKDAVNNLKFLSGYVPLHTFIKEVILTIISLLPLFVFYAVVWGLLLFFAYRLAAPYLASLNLSGAKNFFGTSWSWAVFLLCASIVLHVRRAWPSISPVLKTMGEIVRAICYGIGGIVLAAAFVFFLFTNPLGLVLFIFLFMH